VASGCSAAFGVGYMPFQRCSLPRGRQTDSRSAAMMCGPAGCWFFSVGKRVRVERSVSTGSVLAVPRRRARREPCALRVSGGHPQQQDMAGDQDAPTRGAVADPKWPIGMRYRRCVECGGKFYVERRIDNASVCSEKCRRQLRTRGRRSTPSRTSGDRCSLRTHTEYA
jgi:hypothetical protein